MDLRDYLLLLLRRWTVVAVIFLLTAGGLIGLSLATTPTYAGTASLFVRADLDEPTIADLQNGDTYVRSRISTYAVVVNSEAVLVPVIDGLDLDVTFSELNRAVTAEVTDKSFTITINAEAPTAREAADIANAIADQLPVAAAALDGETSASASTVRFSVVQRALPPRAPTSPNHKLNTAVAVAAGLFLSVLGAVLAETFDTRLRRGTQVTAAGSPYLGGVAAVRGATVRDLLLAGTSDGDKGLHRRMALEMLFSAGTPPVAIVVTAARPGAGVTTVSANIAAALAAEGNRVLYIDTDTTENSFAAAAGVPRGTGFSDVLAGRSDLDMALFHWHEGGFSVLSAGSIFLNTTELLAGETLRRKLDLLLDLFDVVIFDTAPVVSSAVTSMLLRQVPNAVLVAQVRRTRLSQFNAAVSAIERSQARVLGTILTRTGRGTDQVVESEQAPQTGDTAEGVRS